ncbi:YciI family protein [Nonomuraea sp. SBT364]|uniref:YciI family protein n=1 Tax=Nonomuraea sp. SBT364 TaxID=1580530 RepID=UPI0007C793D7|nr:YciI family protein [Nonomuraea sp. SBT364]
MRFALLLFDPEGYGESVTEAEMKAALAEHEAFARYLRERGVPFTGEALRPAARTLRPGPPGDLPVAADGPFVPPRQDLAGFYLVECAGLDEAEEIARHCPIGAGVEIRQIWDAPT